jgi:hypothetical protein
MGGPGSGRRKGGGSKKPKIWGSNGVKRTKSEKKKIEGAMKKKYGKSWKNPIK